MKPFETLDAVAVPFDMSNVDTDQIAPARFLRRPRENGYETFLFRDLRFNADDSLKPDFILNQTVYQAPQIMVVNRNFGGGSSREQAVWCLVDYGIRCIIGSTFGDIFFNNAINHGLLLIRQDEQVCAQLRQQLKDSPGARMQVDLKNQTFTDAIGVVHSFDVEASRKQRLLQGLDEIGLTLSYGTALDAFEDSFRQRHPWLFETSSS